MDIYLAAIFLTVSQTYNLPPGLLRAVCYTESKYDVGALHIDDGSANSVGICQVQLPTARVLGFKGSEADLRKVDTNITMSAAYIAKQLRRYHGDVHKSISAYNAGSYRVSNRGYVSKVLRAWKERR